MTRSPVYGAGTQENETVFVFFDEVGDDSCVWNVRRFARCADSSNVFYASALRAHRRFFEVV